MRRPGSDTDITDTAPPTDLPDATAPVVCVNELVADNVNGATGDDGLPADWVELHNPTTAYVTLDGWSLAGEETTALDGLGIPAGGYLLLWADGTDTPGHLAEALDADGGTLTLTDTDGGEAILHHGGMEADWSAARTTACGAEWGWDWLGTPGYDNAGIAPTMLVAAGATWSWWDSGVAPDATWTEVAFDDSLWPSGPAPLGYGDADIASTVSYGTDAAAVHVTTWFRHRFTVSGTPQSATLRFRADDGALVWLNGTEVARFNLPSAGVDTSTLASATTPQESAWWSYTLTPSLLLAGDNVLAVEVHQAGTTSSDIVWDATIEAVVP